MWRSTRQDNIELNCICQQNLLAAKWFYNNIECEALGTAHGLGKFKCYCFIREICIITDHRPLVAIFNKDVATLSQLLQHIIPRIHQYKLHFIYKPGQNMYIEDWFSSNEYVENRPGNHRDEYKCKCHQHTGIYNSMHVLEGIRATTWEDTHLQNIKMYKYRDGTTQER